MIIETNEAVPLVTDATDIIHVAGTRVTLDTLVEAFQQGATAEEIVQQYPTVPLADVYAVISYYLRHQSEVDAYLARGAAQRKSVREENEKRFNPDGVRARLQARRSPGKT